MRVGVDDSGGDVLAGRIDHDGFRGRLEAGPDRRDAAVADEDVAVLDGPARRGEERPATDEGHRVVAVRSAVGGQGNRRRGGIGAALAAAALGGFLVSAPAPASAAPRGILVSASAAVRVEALAVDEDGLDGGALVEEGAVGDDQVGDLARLDRAEPVVDAEDLGRRQRERPDRVVGREPLGHRPPRRRQCLGGIVEPAGVERELHAGRRKGSGGRRRAVVAPQLGEGRHLVGVPAAGRSGPVQAHQGGHVARGQQVGRLPSALRAVDDGPDAHLRGGGEGAHHVGPARRREQGRPALVELAPDGVEGPVPLGPPPAARALLVRRPGVPVVAGVVVELLEVGEDAHRAAREPRVGAAAVLQVHPHRHRARHHQLARALERPQVQHRGLARNQPLVAGADDGGEPRLAPSFEAFVAGVEAVGRGQPGGRPRPVLRAPRVGPVAVSAHATPGGPGLGLLPVAQGGEGVDQPRIDGLAGAVDDPGPRRHVHARADRGDDPVLHHHRAALDGGPRHRYHPRVYDRGEAGGVRPRRAGLRVRGCGGEGEPREQREGAVRHRATSGDAVEIVEAPIIEGTARGCGFSPRD